MNTYKPGQKIYTNVIIPPNTNPMFSGPTTIEGVVYIKQPNKVTFNGNCTITGVIVGENLGSSPNMYGDSIPLEARIVAVADAIEAMTSDRPYRKGLKSEQVVEELSKHSGTQFDPLVVDAAVRMLSEMAQLEYHPTEAGGRPGLSITKLRPA